MSIPHHSCLPCYVQRLGTLRGTCATLVYEVLLFQSPTILYRRSALQSSVKVPLHKLQIRVCRDALVSLPRRHRLRICCPLRSRNRSRRLLRTRSRMVRSNWSNYRRTTNSRTNYRRRTFDDRTIFVEGIVLVCGVGAFETILAIHAQTLCT